MIIQIVGILLILFFFVVVYMSTKTWRATHVVFLFLVFAATLGFTVLSAATLKTHSAWRELYNRYEKDVEQAIDEQQMLMQGDVQEIVQSEPPLPVAKAQLSRVLLDRGRVWRGAVPVNIAGNAVTVQMAAPGGPEDAVKPSGLEQNMIVYLFKEAETAEGLKVPSMYLGEYDVTSTDQASVTLTPKHALDQQQLAQIQADIQAGNASWAIYEMMPLDGRETFAGLDEQQLRTLMPQPQGMTDERYNAMIQTYVRSGQRAQQGDPPANVWSKVRIVKQVPDDYTVQTASGDSRPLKQVDSTEQQQPGQRSFDTSGLAVVDRLRRGGQADLPVGETVILDTETAAQLVQDGYAELVEPVYLRTLNDYEFAFHEMFSRLRRLQDDITRIERDTAAMEDAEQKAQQHIAYRQQEQTALQEDLQNFQKEREAIVQLAEAFQQKYQELRAELSRIYRTNLMLEQELDEASQKVIEQLERSTDNATAQLQ